MLVAHRIALQPNKAQALYFAHAAGTARFAYNWALDEWKQQAQDWWYSGKLAPFPSDISLRKDFNSIKHVEFPWVSEVSKCAVQEAIIDLSIAFRNYKSPTHKGRYPKFKSKAKATPSFCAANEAGTFRANNKRIKLPVIGWVRMREAVRFQGPLKRVTVSKTAGRWFVSVLVETGEVKPIIRPIESRVVGVDLGVTTLAMLSTGEAVQGPKAHGAAGNRHIARAINDAGFGEFRRMLEYKARWYGAQIVVADRFYPSSKTCSECGVVRSPMSLAVRAWTCDDCGASHDRDLNAARNLERLAASSAATAGGERRSGAERKPRVKRRSVKQEENEVLSKEAA